MADGLGNLSGPPSRERVESLVQRALHAVASACQSRRDQAPVLTVFTGATAGFTQALSGLEQLMLNGISLEILVSKAAGHLCGDVIEGRLMAWPTARPFDPADWFVKVQNCSGVVVPLLSVATLSRVCSLAPDTLASNIILQALFMGKPVVAAIDGAAPFSPDRAALGLGKGTPALKKALADRLIQLSDFGAGLTRARDLGRAGLKALDENSRDGAAAAPAQGKTPSREVLGPPAANPAVRPRAAFVPGPVRLVDAGMVRQARHTEPIIRCARGAVVTPLARELASSYGVDIRPGAPEV